MHARVDDVRRMAVGLGARIMSSMRWARGFAAAVAVLTAAGTASAEAPEPGWGALQGHAVVVERQDGSLVAGKLVAVGEGSVEVQAPDGTRTVVERAGVKAVRSKLSGQQAVVVMKENDAQVAGKLVESDPKTVVVVTDEGRRVTLERASIQVVRERFPAALAPAPRPASTASGDPHETSLEDPPPEEEKPSSGITLIGVGSAIMGVGGATMGTFPQCYSEFGGDPGAQSLCLKATFAIGGGIIGLGIPFLIGGAVQRSHFVKWQSTHPLLSFVPAQGGGTVTWQGTF